MTRKQKVRENFRVSVFKRDKNTCVCGKSAQDAHHITDRSEMPNGSFKLMYLVFFFIIGLDIHSTYVLIHSGMGEEGNPIMAAMMDKFGVNTSLVYSFVQR